jgi:hypothetical protein
LSESGRVRHIGRQSSHSVGQRITILRADHHAGGVLSDEVGRLATSGDDRGAPDGHRVIELGRNEVTQQRMVTEWDKQRVATLHEFSDISGGYGRTHHHIGQLKLRDPCSELGFKGSRADEEKFDRLCR